MVVRCNSLAVPDSTPYLARMAKLSRAVASLRVSGDELVPDEVTRLLGAEPAIAYARGDEIGSKHGAGRIAKVRIVELLRARN